MSLVIDFWCYYLSAHKSCLQSSPKNIMRFHIVGFKSNSLECGATLSLILVAHPSTSHPPFTSQSKACILLSLMQPIRQQAVFVKNIITSLSHIFSMMLLNLLCLNRKRAIWEEVKEATLKPTYQITEISNLSLSWVGSYCETNDCVPGCHLSGHSFGSSWKSWMVFYSFNLPKLQTWCLLWCYQSKIRTGTISMKCEIKGAWKWKTECWFVFTAVT